MTSDNGQGRRLLEVCVDDAQGLATALAGGADRIELCSSLIIGGLTPPRSFMRHAAGLTRLPVYPLLRPRLGDFAYSAVEVAMIADDIDAARDAGLTGVVIGASRDDGTLDADALGRLVKAAAGLDLTLHRAFDLVPDPFAALETAIALGFRRILTSGCARTVSLGWDTIAELNRRAAGRIVIMPGGGVDPAMTTRFVRELGLTEVHASGGRARAASGRVAEFGFAPASGKRTDLEEVRRLKAALVQA